MSSTQEIYRRLITRGTQVVCEGTGEGPYARFEGRIAAIHDDVVHLNVLSGRNIDHLVQHGESVTMYFSGNVGWFMCVARRIDNVVPGGMTLRVLNGPTRVERREYLRIRCRLNVRWSVIDGDAIPIEVAPDGKVTMEPRSIEPAEPSALSPENIEDPIARQLISALFERINVLEEELHHMRKEEVGEIRDQNDVAVDISGSGFRIATRAHLRNGDFIEGCIDLGEEGQKVHFTAQVIRADPPNLGRTTHCAGCHFCSIAEHDREILIRYIFREHRRQLRDSLI